MASIASSELSSAPATSSLERSTDLQREDDFGTTAAIFSASETAPTLEGYEGILWEQIPGWRIPSDDKKIRTWVVKQGHGWRLEKVEGKEVTHWWHCKLCHRAKKHLKAIFRMDVASSSAIQHMRNAHHLGEHGPVQKKRRIGDSAMQSYIQSGSNPANAIQNEHALTFDAATFKTLLYDWIVTESISFRQVESPALHAMLAYLQHRAEQQLPSRKTVAATIGRIYDQVLSEVTECLRSAITKINLSFDLWTSGNKLALLGITASFINADGALVTTLLAMPRVHGAHTGLNQSESIAALIAQYDLGSSIGYFVTDNASSNDVAIRHLAKEFSFDAKQRHIRCFGHVLNLVAQAVLLGSDSEAFEAELNTTLTVEEAQLQLWRKKGPIGKLHNVIYWIVRSPQRNERLMNLQKTLIAPNRPDDKKETYELVKDVETRWNSFDDAAKRALYLRPAIDELIMQESLDYNAYLERCAIANRVPKKKAPAIVADRLTVDDWHVITLYHEILQPLKHWTMQLQGQAGADRFGAIWRVIPAYEELLHHFETLRERYPLNESLAMYNQATRSSRLQADRQSQLTFNTVSTTSQAIESQAEPDQQATAEHHLSTNINLGWLKLEEYYQKLDDTPVYVAAVVLHPRMKWRWIEKAWAEHYEWLPKTRLAFTKLMLQYKGIYVRPQRLPPQRRTSDDEDDVLSDEEGPTTGIEQQLAQYEAEPRHATIMMKESPIPYWLTQRHRWPELTQLALDTFSTPAMSDEPERVFSETGAMLSPRRRQMSAETVQQTMCLRQWRRRGLFTWSRSLFEAHGSGSGIAAAFNVATTS